MKMNIQNDRVFKSLEKILCEEYIIIMVTKVLSQPKEPPLILTHFHILLFEVMELINMSLIIL